MEKSGRKKKEEIKDRSEYQKDYYLRRKEELSEKRKSRYKGDEVYRKKIIEASNEYRQRKKEREDKLRAEGKLPPKYYRRPKRMEVNGKIVRVYSFAMLCTKIASEDGWSRNTVQRWKQLGTLPDSPLRTPKGRQLFTDSMINSIRLAIKHKGVVGNDPSIRDEIIKRWKRIGIVAE